MTELLIIVPVIWAILVTWGLGNLYTRPVAGLDPDDVDLIKEFMEQVRRMAAKAEREAKRGKRG